MTNAIFDKLVTVVTLIVIGACLVALSWLSKSDEATEQKRMKMYCDNVAAWELDRDMGIDPYDRKGHPNFNRADCEGVLTEDEENTNDNK